MLWLGSPSLIIAHQKLILLLIATPVIAWYEINFGKNHANPIYAYLIYCFILGFSFSIWAIKIMQLKATHYILKKDRLLVERGILRRKTDELELFRVRDFQLDEPLLMRAFNLGNIILVTTDKTTPIVQLDAIFNIREVHENLRKLVIQSWDDRGVKEVELG